MPGFVLSVIGVVYILCTSAVSTEAVVLLLGRTYSLVYRKSQIFYGSLCRSGF
jgi:hypothetical protein